MKNLKDYQDAHGFIGHKDDQGLLEFGDGAQRLGMYYLFRYINCPGNETRALTAVEFLNRYESLFLPTGEPVRHWDHYTNWWSKPGTMSRDQIFPLIACLAAMGLKKELISITWKLLKRGMFCWNTKHIGQHDDKWKIPDWCGPLTWLTIIRGLLKPTDWWSVLLGLIFLVPMTLADTLLIPATLVRVIVPLWDWDNVGDDLNHFNLHLVNYSVWPTITSYVCFVLYLFRPQAGPPNSYVRSQGEIGVIQAFRWYFFGDKNPPLDDEALKTLKKVL